MSRTGVDSSNVEPLLRKSVSKAVGTDDLSEIIKAIKERKESAISAIRACTFEELGVAEPTFTKKERAIILGEAYEEEKEEEKKEGEQEAPEVFLMDGFGTRYRQC